MQTLQWKRVLGKFYPLHSPVGRKIILLYHAVGSGPQALSAALFEEQMAWLNRHCEVKTLSGLLKSTNDSDDKIEVAISFDDGYACLYEVVAPILKQFQTPAVVYLNTGWIGQGASLRKSSQESLGHYAGESFLIWPEVKALYDQGWEIGSHGVDHVDLTQAGQQVDEQLQYSKIAIESVLGRSCDHFAYTWGRHHRMLRQAVARVGYQSAVAAHHQPLRQRSSLYALPRMNIASDYTMNDFKQIVLGRWDYLNGIHQMKRWVYG